MEERLRTVVEDLIPEGVTTLLISTAPPADWPFENDHDLWLIVRVGQERFVLPLVAHGVEEDVQELMARVRSALSDWIAENQFGWGSDGRSGSRLCPQKCHHSSSRILIAESRRPNESRTHRLTVR